MRLQSARLALLIMSLSASLADAQYDNRRDTVRYREVTTGEMRLRTPQGEIPMTSGHDATIAVARRGGDTVHAWYEALAISLVAPSGEVRPPTDSVLGVPFVLAFDRGRARAIRTPTFSADIKGVTDLSQQFHDFFVRLPAQPLAVGLAWTDTLAMSDSIDGRSRESRQIATYRVERDTVVDGVRAVVISLSQTMTMRSEGPMSGQPVRSESRLDGIETGFVVFAPTENRLLARRREGVAKGPLVMRGAMGEMTLTQEYRYTSSIDAIGAARNRAP